MNIKHISLSQYRSSKLADYNGIKTIELGDGFIKKRQINGAIRWFNNRKIQVNLTQHQMNIINEIDK